MKMGIAFVFEEIDEIFASDYSFIEYENFSAQFQSKDDSIIFTDVTEEKN